MSLEGVTETVMDTLKLVLKEKILELIPTLMKEITPDIIRCAKDSIETFVLDNDLLQETVKQTLVTTQEEVDNFVNSFRWICNEKLKERDNNFWKYSRCDRLLSLYNECLQAEPMYIPKEYRNDRYHVMSKQELNIVTKMDLKRFQGECEILKCRREEFLSRVKSIDEEYQKMIDESNVSQNASQKLVDRWQNLIKEDMEKVNSKWDKRIESTKKAFQKDKEYFYKHQTERVKPKINHVKENQSTSIKVTFSTKDENIRTYSEVLQIPSPVKSTKVVVENAVAHSNGMVNDVACSNKLDSCKDTPKEKEISKNEKSHPSHEPPSQTVQQPQANKMILRNQRSSTCLNETLQEHK